MTHSKFELLRAADLSPHNQRVIQCLSLLSLVIYTALLVSPSRIFFTERFPEASNDERPPWNPSPTNPKKELARKVRNM